ncbi:methionine--tRNA ligase [Phanerochaete sordida]|uniref:Probable methionine--tRNA ligase, mitochondrial n=1 Tax=Phanerochaete sordida TaxID=48140 RepID=A0A9P3G4H4_9APHY|nr:methionine--tRNA ligase [Phanerochaete sordida]
MVIADICTRYEKLTYCTHWEVGRKHAYLMTGTDEHGLKIQQAAKAKGLEPLAFCDELSQRFRELAAKANVGYTHFSRTTERKHHEAVEHLWRGLDAKGLIYKGQHEGWYSITDECFYTDTQVTKGVPSGPAEKERYVSLETGSTVEWTQEENYKFRLSAFRESLLEHYKGHPDAVYPEQFHSEVVATLSGDLDDISVSRPRSRLSWGIPVPNDPEHTIYVWIDALTVYLSAVGYPWTAGSESQAKAWPPDVQVIGKDILRFHAIYLPAMLQALGLPLSKQLLTHSHWTVDQRKMSKSVGNVADPIEAIDEFGADVVRYYLARVGGRFKDDVDWSHDQLDKHYRELMSLVGNTYLRITSPKILNKIKHDEEAEDAEEWDPYVKRSEDVEHLKQRANDLGEKVEQEMSELKIASALEHIIDVLKEANQVMSQTQPWADSTDPKLASNVHVWVCEALRICGVFLQPFIPATATKLLDALGCPEHMRDLGWVHLGATCEACPPAPITPGVRLFDPPKRGAKARRPNGGGGV